ncbi:hypothetical protein EON67_03555 [archaeon]|nr:MAG: hypothetical protein EON67_03555 [archaeon]
MEWDRAGDALWALRALAELPDGRRLRMCLQDTLIFDNVCGGKCVCLYVCVCVCVCVCRSVCSRTP